METFLKEIIFYHRGGSIRKYVSDKNHYFENIQMVPIEKKHLFVWDNLFADPNQFTSSRGNKRIHSKYQLSHNKDQFFSFPNL